MLDCLNNLFAIPLVSVITGIVAGGAITWFVARLYYKKAGDELKAEAAHLHRISQMILAWLEADGRNVSVTRGEDGEPTGLKFDMTLETTAHAEAELNAIARRLNERPRKTLNYQTPAERFHQSVASTG